METYQPDVERFIGAGGLTVCPPSVSSQRLSASASSHKRYAAHGSHIPNVTFEFPEANMAKALILLMLQDLAGKGCDGGDYQCKEKHRSDAHRWFFRKACANDFEAWCMIAGYEAEFIRGVASSVMVNGMPMLRIPPGQSKHYERGRKWRSNNKKKRK